MMRMSDILVRELESSEYIMWDDLVEKSPHGTVFHKSDWLAICKEVLNKNPRIYGCFQNNELIGGCSLFINKAAGVFKVASSTCEMTPYGGIVIKELPSTKIRKKEQESHKIMDSLRKFLCDRFDSIKIRFSPDFLDLRPFTWNGWDSNILYTYYMDLQRDVDENISKNIKRDIKNAENEIKIRKLNDPKIYCDLQSMVYGRQNLNPPAPAEFFFRVFDLMESKTKGYMLVSETPSKEIVAAHVRLYDKDKIFAWAAASNPKFRANGYNTLLYYNEFKYLRNKNFRYMNMMAANTQRFTNFITGFNPKLIPHYSIRFNNRVFGFFEKIYR